jgi:hypothetical protein
MPVQFIGKEAPLGGLICSSSSGLSLAATSPTLRYGANKSLLSPSRAHLQRRRVVSMHRRERFRTHCSWPEHIPPADRMHRKSTFSCFDLIRERVQGLNADQFAR